MGTDGQHIHTGTTGTLPKYRDPTRIASKGMDIILKKYRILKN